MSEVEETLKRINSHKGVQGIVIVNSEGVPIRSTIDQSLTTQYAANLTQLAAKARSVVRDLDPQNDLTFLRIRSKKYEILVAPDKVREAAAAAAAPHSSSSAQHRPPLRPQRPGQIASPLTRVSLLCVRRRISTWSSCRTPTRSSKRACKRKGECSRTQEVWWWSLLWC